MFQKPPDSSSTKQQKVILTVCAMDKQIKWYVLIVKRNSTDIRIGLRRCRKKRRWINLRFFKIVFFIIVLSSDCFSDGYSPSTLKEVVKEFQSIYVVKITKVVKERPFIEKETSPQKLVIHFIITEAIKGNKTSIHKATYILPSFVHIYNGMELRMWLKIPGSGIELQVVKNKEYIIYSKYDLPTVQNQELIIHRIDKIGKKPQLLKLLNTLK